MRTMLRRMVALLAMVVLGGTGVALATAWSPTAGLVAPAAAGDDDGGDGAGGDDDGGDDDGGRAPAGGVDTGLGGAAGDDDGDDDGAGGDDDGGDDDGGDGAGGDGAGGQGAPAPAPAPAVGGGGDDDDDGGQVPAGGVQTGFGGTAETVSSTGEPDNGLGDVAKAVAPAAVVGLGGYALLRMRAARSDSAA